MDRTAQQARPCQRIVAWTEGSLYKSENRNMFINLDKMSVIFYNWEIRVSGRGLC